MTSLHNITYGLFILTAKNDTKQNGCIINTLIQVTNTPNRISITVNKQNYTTKIIEETGIFNVSILDTTTSFDIIQKFGFCSGIDTNKFDNFSNFQLATNGVAYITEHTNSYLSAKVISKIDIGTHITFIADITEDVVINTNKSLTYAYYLENIKPKPQASKKRVYVCSICGYMYDNDQLPEDFVCPLCKHGASDFELLEI